MQGGSASGRDTSLTEDLARARDREAATREILEVISQSREDDGPVFDVIVNSAARLCNAPMAWLVICNDAQTAMTVAGYHGLTRRQIKTGDTFELGREADTITCLGRAIIEARSIQDEDLALTPAYLNGVWDARKLVDDEGMRSRVSIPLVSGGKGIGAIILSRREVRPFNSDEIALVETFAAQAVIAIENVFQFRELQTRLEREKASAEILEVISQSREDDGPVFDVILRNAARLCKAPIASLMLVNAAGTHLVMAAMYGETLRAHLTGDTWPIDPPPEPVARSIRTARTVHSHDLSLTDEYRSGHPTYVRLVEEDGVRTDLSVPLLRYGVGFGAIILSRHVVDPFSEGDIALIETFAAQAVIAIENVRQFRELQTRLAREAATREILEVISQSRDDEKPVFDVLLRKAAQLCGAPMANLSIITDDGHHSITAAQWGEHRTEVIPVGSVWPLDSPYAPETCMREGRIVHIHDLADTDLYLSGDPVRTLAVDNEGVRTLLNVPLVSDGRIIGCISTYRHDVRPFTPDEIALVETFAAQAVIAIENVRQFRELQTRLAREAATREILEVISQSRDDDKPVFDVVLRNAAELCHASMDCLNIISDDRSHAVMVADWGNHVADQFPVGKTVWSLDANSATSTCLREGRIERLEDMADSDLYRSGDPMRVAAVDEDGLRTFLAVPLFSGDQTVACISIYRREVAPFTPDQIALVETFAAQAVIAIENVRQFRELQTRLAREAATREILEVISRNPDDDRPVFDAILGNAIRLCGADTSALFLGRKDDPRLTLAAWRDRAASSSVMEDEMIVRTNATPMRMDPTVHVSAKVIIEERNIHMPDLHMHPSYLAGEPSYRIFGDALGIRSALIVPLIDARGALGVVQVHRRDVRAFTPDEIALVETFAAQAVIAIENVRQFKALEALNAELGERVDEQVGEIERMGRLKRFLPAAVADAVVSSGSEKMLSSHRALLGVLFCDIRGFTAFCETAEPEETIEVLQTYHEEMGKLINAHGAGVDHRMGDGIMVLFNDPLPCDDPAGEALRLAIAMRARMAELGQQWKRLGHRLGFGVGISLGYATVGMVGFEGRFDYTASGTAINLASRLCDEALDGEILLSPRAAVAVEDRFPVDCRGEVILKGIREPVEVFRLTPTAA
jgi:GAF domain-containing protein